MLRRRPVLAGLSALSVTGAAARADQAKLTLGIGIAGGSTEIYGVSFVNAVRAVDPLIEVVAVTTKGVLDNVTLLEAGKLDLGLVFGEVAHDLFSGTSRPPTKLKVLSVMYSVPGMFVVRADSRSRSIDDLKGRPVVWNTRDGGLAVQARYVMDGLGLDMDKDFEAIYTERLRDGPDKILDGSAVAMWGGGKRWPGFVTVATSTRGARFIVPSADEIKRIRTKYPFMQEFVVPAGLYPGQYDPLTTVGTWGCILARADLDEAVGFRLAAALHKNERAGQFSKQLTESTPKIR
jgi:TRAP transporter TAXI family solute receptor